MERLHKLARRRRLPASQGGFVYICGTCEEPLQGRKQMTRHLLEDHEEEFAQFSTDFKGAKQSDKDFESQISKMMISVNFEPFNEETAKNTLEQILEVSKQNGNGVQAAAKNGAAEVVTLEKDTKDPIFEDPTLTGAKRPPLTLDIMKLTDVRSCNLKNTGGITGRVAKLLGLVFEKTLLNPHPVFSCKHCDEEIEDGDAEDMRKHLESQHEDFLANLNKVFPQASKRMDQHITKALQEYKFKPAKKVLPLTLDTMKLQDTRTQSLKNYGGIAGRIARQIGLVFKKDIETDGVEFKDVHRDEVVEEKILKDHLKNVHESFFANLLKIFRSTEEKMAEHIANAASGFELKVPTGEEQDEEEKDLIDGDDEEEEEADEEVPVSDDEEEEGEKEDDEDESDTENIEEVNLESDDDDDEIEEVEKVEEKSATKRKGETDKKESPKKKKMSEPVKKSSPKKKKVSESEDEDKASDTEIEKDENGAESGDSDDEKEEEEEKKDEKEEEDIPGVTKATMLEVDDATKKRDDTMSGRLAAQLELVFSFEGEEGSMKAVCEGCAAEITEKAEVGNHIKTAHAKVYENITDIVNTKEGEVLPTTPASMARFFSKAAAKMGIKA